MAGKKGSTATPKYKPYEKPIGPISEFLGKKPLPSFSGKSSYTKKGK